MIRFLLIFLILIAGAGAAGYYFVLPDILEKEIATKFEDAGFNPNIIYKKAQHGDGVIRFENLAFDDDGFTRLDALEIRYDLIELLQHRRASHIVLKGLDLYGDLDDDFEIRMLGIKSPDVLFQHHAHFDRFEMRDSQLTLNSKDLGAVIIGFDTHGDISKGQIALRTKAYLSHGALRLNGSGAGLISDQSWWTHDFEIEDASLKLPALEFKRASGQLRLNGSTLDDIQLEGAFRSDGMVAGGQPWKSASMSLNGSLQQTEMLLSGKSGQDSLLEISLSMPEAQRSSTFAGSVYSDDFETLKRFLNGQDLIEVSPAFLGEQRPDGILNAEFYKSGRDVSLLWTHAERPVEETPPPTPSREDILSAPSPLRFSALIDGDAFTEGVLALGGYRIRALDARKDQRDKRSCSVSDFPAKHDCEISFSWNEKPAFSSLSVRAAFGEALISAANLKEKTLDILFNDIDAAEIINIFGFDGWKASGKFKGSIRIDHRNGTERISKIEFTNAGEGVLSVRNQAFLKYLIASVEERDMIIMAIENLEYQKLRINIQNLEDGLYRVQISATGRNPNLMQGRKFALDFDFKAPLEDVFQAMMP